MVEHDGHVGQLLKKLDDLKIADNTIVIYTTDNGAEKNMWPDGGIRRSAARRTPTGKAASACRAGPLARRDQAGHDLQRPLLAEDWLPTLVAAAGDPTSRRSC